MSWRATAFVAELTDDLTAAEKLVLLVLANRHHQDTNLCNPSIPRLAREALVSERTLYRHLKSLEDKGFLRRSAAGGGRGQTNEYEIVGLVIPAIENVNPDRLTGFRAPKTLTNRALNPVKSGRETLTENAETLSNQVVNPDTALSPEQGNKRTGSRTGKNGGSAREGAPPVSAIATIRSRYARALG